ncbi:MAG: hypothetical protein HUJ71_10075 [Pseudobutyrivibrio sp.]|nr:hypothetical protein [Pseudobutyrivibrio sp.]
MNSFIRVRDGIRRFVLAREVLMLRIWNFIVAFVGMMVINSNFGYLKNLNHWYVNVAVAAISAFLPMNGAAALLALVLIADLTSLSLQVALIALGFWVVSIIVCAYFRSKNTYNTVVVPLTYSLNCPYVIAMGAGLLRDFKELTSVICGSVFAYYLHIIKINSSTILDETADISVISLLVVQMVQNKMFYIFVIAMVAMFITVYTLRQQSIRMSWLVADVAGVVVEFIIMLVGLIITSQRGEIGSLILANLVVFLVGVFMNYFILDLDYSRIEKVQFEDDDYYYYVAAIPKIRMVDEDKEIKTF